MRWLGKEEKMTDKKKKVFSFYLSLTVAEWLAAKKKKNPHVSISSFVNEALEAVVIKEMENNL